MPSTALQNWTNDRLPRLNRVKAQCTAVAALAPPNPTLLDENLRGYVMLLSAHFQGFCRALYTECVQLCSAPVPPGLQMTVQAQSTAELQISKHNPTVKTIKADFERFGFTLRLAAADPANPARITHLDHMNDWRNTAAHHRTSLPAHPAPAALSLPVLRDWQAACDGLAVSLDGIMYDELLRILGVAPW